MVSMPDSVVKYRLQVFLQSVDGVSDTRFSVYSFTVHRLEAFLENENSDIKKLFGEVDKSSGELVTLTPNNNNTVQPVALMRLGVFVPTLKSLKNSKKNTLSRTDATEELTRLSLARAEGFDKVEITGPRLDMDNDFKTWVGIIHSFARHNVIGDKVELPFVEFAKLCGIPSSQSSRRLRERISPSLKRIAGTVISFSRTDEKHTREYITHLVQSAYYDTERDIVQLQADPRLFELYQFDRKVLLQLKAINALKRRESAQALYTFIESLPRDPAPISLAAACTPQSEVSCIFPEPDGQTGNGAVARDWIS
ncbi:putative RepFIB replication protein A [Escherichia coli]|nr:putative RepFIB replication protein A [Escherichia coli]